LGAELGLNNKRNKERALEKGFPLSHRFSAVSQGERVRVKERERERPTFGIFKELKSERCMQIMAYTLALSLSLSRLLANHTKGVV